MEYLTGPNPAVNLVRQVNLNIGRGLNTHFWWDVRNLESSWDDFNFDTIESIPDFAKLLAQPQSRSLTTCRQRQHTSTP
jgi:hypothetical protein